MVVQRSVSGRKSHGILDFRFEILDWGWKVEDGGLRIGDLGFEALIAAN